MGLNLIYILLLISISSCGGLKYAPPSTEVCIIGPTNLACTDIRKSKRPYFKPHQVNQIIIHPSEYSAAYSWCSDVVKNLILCKKGYTNNPPGEYPYIKTCISSQESIVCFNDGENTYLPYSEYVNWISVDPRDYNNVRNWCDTKAEELISCRESRY